MLSRLLGSIWVEVQEDEHSAAGNGDRKFGPCMHSCADGHSACVERHKTATFVERDTRKRSFASKG